MPRLEMNIQSQLSANGLQGGGEVHYVSACASGRITRVMLADICATREMFHQIALELRRTLVQSINSIWQRKIIAQTSRQLSRFAAKGGFASACLATFFAPTRTLSVCNAGNPPPLLYHAADQEWRVVKCVATHSGSGESYGGDSAMDESEYQMQRVKLQKDDVIVLMGNGFTQSHLPCGGLATHQKCLELLNHHLDSNPMTALGELYSMVNQESVPEEDQTLISCRVTDTRVSMVDNLLAPLRWLHGGYDETKITAE